MDQEKVWDMISEEWSIYRTKIPPTVKNFLKNKKGRILDMGCGSGRNFIKKSSLEWYGIDFSEKMLEYAKEKADKLRIKVVLKKLESHDTKFNENFFDVVLCYSVLHCIKSSKKRKETLKEIYRILKPGGYALISCWGKKSPRLKDKGNECFVPWTIRKGKKIERYTYLFDLDELVRLSEKTGFKIQKAWEERNVNLIVKKSIIS